MNRKERETIEGLIRGFYNMLPNNYKAAYNQFKNNMNIIDRKMRLSEEERVYFDEYYAASYLLHYIKKAYNLEAASTNKVAAIKGNTNAIHLGYQLSNIMTDIEKKMKRLDYFDKQLSLLMNQKR